MSFMIHRLREAADGPGARLCAHDRGLQYGDGVFDTMTVRSGRPLLFERHMARLAAAAELIGIEVDTTAFEAVVLDLLRDLKKRDAIVRTTLTRGIAPRGLWPANSEEPTILSVAQPWELSLVGQPARLSIASAPRNERSMLSRIKSLAYLDNVLAAREAAEAGADDALFLNTRGHVACTTIANLFAVHGHRLATPRLEDGCLDGVMRGFVLEEAAAFGLVVDELPLRLDDVLGADAVFLTNSVRLLRPVTALGGRAYVEAPVVAHLLHHLRDRLLPQ
jgi:branched-chain amino acid aminotransferase